MMTATREIAYRLDPVVWVREVLGVTPHAWQERFLRARRGQCIAALTARQVGKSTVAAWGTAGTLHCSRRDRYPSLPAEARIKVPKWFARFVKWS